MHTHSAARRVRSKQRSIGRAMGSVIEECRVESVASTVSRFDNSPLSIIALDDTTGRYLIKCNNTLSLLQVRQHRFASIEAHPTAPLLIDT